MVLYLFQCSLFLLQDSIFTIIEPLNNVYLITFLPFILPNQHSFYLCFMNVLLFVVYEWIRYVSFSSISIRIQKAQSKMPKEFNLSIKYQKCYSLEYKEMPNVKKSSMSKERFRNDRMNNLSLIWRSQQDRSYYRENRLMNGESSNQSVNFGTSIPTHSYLHYRKMLGWVYLFNS